MNLHYLEVMGREKKKYYSDIKDSMYSWFIRDENFYIWEYQKLLRLEEFCLSNCARFSATILRRKRNMVGIKLGISISPFSVDEGLRIWHSAGIVINPRSKIGKNLTLHGANCIGNSGDNNSLAPTLGSNIDVGFGAVVIGEISLADDIRIGAGAVVVKDLTVAGTVVGCPAVYI